jgi:hypothetical protein
MNQSERLRAAAQAVIEWENDYRTLNNLGKYPPHVFVELAAALAEPATGSTPPDTRQAIRQVLLDLFNAIEPTMQYDTARERVRWVIDAMDEQPPAPAASPSQPPEGNHCVQCGKAISVFSSFHHCSECRKNPRSVTASPSGDKGALAQGLADVAAGRVRPLQDIKDELKYGYSREDMDRAHGFLRGRCGIPHSREENDALHRDLAIQFAEARASGDKGAASIVEDKTWRGGWVFTCQHGNKAGIGASPLDCGCHLAVVLASGDKAPQVEALTEPFEESMRRARLSEAEWWSDGVADCEAKRLRLVALGCATCRRSPEARGRQKGETK